MHLNLTPAQIESFWLLVDRSGGPDACWPWTGNLRKNGYGQHWTGKRSTTYPHRIAVVLTTGIDDDSLYVCHRCDNPSCCNPAHLFLGTQTDNMRDAANKGRIPGPGWIGSEHPRAKLTEAIVIEVRRRRREGETILDLAAEFGVSAASMGYAIRGQTWKHVKDSHQ